MQRIAERVFRLHQSAIAIDVDAPVDDMLPIVIARRQAKMLHGRSRRLRIAIGRFMPYADAHQMSLRRDIARR